MSRRYPLAAALLLAASFVANAQVAGVDAPVCNAQFAQLLVQQQVMESKSVTEPVKRIKILLRSADFLWPFDEPTARTYFTEAWKLADDRFKEKGYESTSIGKEARVIVTQPDQRMEVIRSIMKRDKEWAKKLADQMLADYQKNPKDGVENYRELNDVMPPRY